MDRTLLFLALSTALPFLGVMVYNGVADPLAEQRRWLKNEIAKADAARQDEEGAALQDASWQEAINARPSAWQPITESPEAPKAAPVGPPPPPDVKKMLEGVRVTRSQIGQRVKVVTPENERGDWYVAGDAIKGCVLVSFDKSSAVFEFNWREGGKTLQVVLNRE